jgi:hypothetical protein
MCWADNNVLAIVHKDPSTHACQLMLFPRTHLDFNSVLSKIDVCTGSVSMMSKSANSLVIYDSQHKIHIYQIGIEYHNTGNFTTRH